ncbi:YaiI/YqxD family protein [Saliniramus sp.]|uniref:YaiI/YqxD family protein n=1 Tax=Saliniramus sp. TaxID=2986772 RepID=UPI002BAD1AAD|nr:YaiI/YqxD family protein [Saliniramus sp.]HMB10267.1 YaiI/YqxD family protein [Saliniramus sp.]
MSGTDGPTLFIDADACPVKDECYRVAARHVSQVFLVSNRRIGVPRDPQISLVVVDEGLDKADDWIAERAVPRSVVVTADIPLAARCVAAGGQAVTPKGEILDESRIGMALASRNLMTDLRSAGQQTGGPAPFASADRSRFLQSLESAMRRAARAG